MKYFFEKKSHNAEKIEREDPLVSPNGKKEKPFCLSSCAIRCNLKFCRTFGRTILVTSGVSKKTLTKSHVYGRFFSQKKRRLINRIIRSTPLEKVILNVGGRAFCTFKQTLKSVPRTRLYELMKCPTNIIHPDHYDEATNQYFFDRHPGIFEYILNYYRYI